MQHSCTLYNPADRAEVIITRRGPIDEITFHEKNAAGRGNTIIRLTTCYTSALGERIICLGLGTTSVHRYVSMGAYIHPPVMLLKQYLPVIEIIAVLARNMVDYSHQLAVSISVRNTGSSTGPLKLRGGYIYFTLTPRIVCPSVVGFGKRESRDSFWGEMRFSTERVDEIC